MKDDTKAALLLFRDHGKHPGDFLYHVLTNDLVEAIRAADNDNCADLREIVIWIHDHMPWQAWSTEPKVKMWIRSGGLKKMEELFYAHTEKLSTHCTY